MLDVFGREIVRGDLLLSVLICLSQATPDLQAKILRDLNLLFIRKRANVLHILRIQDWQMYIYPVLFNVPCSAETRTELQEEAMRLTLNVLALPFVHAFAYTDARKALWETSIAGRDSLRNSSTTSSAVTSPMQTPPPVKPSWTSRLSIFGAKPTPKDSVVLEDKDAAAQAASPHTIRFALARSLEILSMVAGWGDAAVGLARRLFLVVLGKISGQTDMRLWKTDLQRLEWDYLLEVALLAQEFIFHHPGTKQMLAMGRRSGARVGVPEQRPRSTLLEPAKHEYEFEPFVDANEDEIGLHIDAMGRNDDLALASRVVSLFEEAKVDELNPNAAADGRKYDRKTSNRIRRLQWVSHAFHVYVDILCALDEGHAIDDGDINEACVLLRSSPDVMNDEGPSPWKRLRRVTGRTAHGGLSDKLHAEITRQKNSMHAVEVRKVFYKRQRPVLHTRTAGDKENADAASEGSDPAPLPPSLKLTVSRSSNKGERKTADTSPIRQSAVTPPVLTEFKSSGSPSHLDSGAEEASSDDDRDLAEGKVHLLEDFMSKEDKDLAASRGHEEDLISPHLDDSGEGCLSNAEGKPNLGPSPSLKSSPSPASPPEGGSRDSECAVVTPRPRSTSPTNAVNVNRHSEVLKEDPRMSDAAVDPVEDERRESGLRHVLDTRRSGKAPQPAFSSLLLEAYVDEEIDCEKCGGMIEKESTGIVAFGHQAFHEDCCDCTSCGKVSKREGCATSP
eukprot:scaffold7595_cov267-Pinguiococcus_pyrenoidosus.AAC.11